MLESQARDKEAHGKPYTAGKRYSEQLNPIDILRDLDKAKSDTKADKTKYPKRLANEQT
jgi:hypothetical protein